MRSTQTDVRRPQRPSPTRSRYPGRAARQAGACLRAVSGTIVRRVLPMLVATVLAAPGPVRAAGDTGSWQGIRPLEPALAAPEVAFVNAAGDYRGFVEFRGQVLVAVFWATWCPVCALEMPKLDRLQAKLGGQGLRVLALSQDVGGAEVVERYYAERGIDHLEIYLDQEAILGSVLGIRGVPTIFVIDRAGRMVGAVEGMADWDSDEAVAFLSGLLDQR